MNQVPLGGLATFLLDDESPQALPEAFVRHVPDGIRQNLGGIMLLSLGHEPAEFTSIAASWPKPVYFVDTFGLVGWCVKKEKNVELYEQGRGAEYGAPGPPEGHPGILVVVSRKGNGCPVMSVDGEAPTVGDGAVAHCLFSAFEHEADTVAFTRSEKHAVMTGGFVKRVLEFRAGGWEERKMVVLTMLKSEASLVNVCHSVIGTAGPIPVHAESGIVLAETLPSGYLPVFICSFQSLMRGYNCFNKNDVEVDGLMELFGKTVPCFGTYLRGEIANTPQCNPLGWNNQTSSESATSFHAFMSSICVYAEYSNSPDSTDKKQGKKTTEEAQDQPALAEPEEIGSTVETAQVADADFQPYMRYLRATKLPFLGLPTTSCRNFWVVPGGLTDEECYKVSIPSTYIDVFLSHAMSFDRDAPIELLRHADTYGLLKCCDVHGGCSTIEAHLIKEGVVEPEKAMEHMMELRCWCDRSCVDHSDTERKMHILIHHLEDFIKAAKFALCLVNTSYFTRLWCLYEFCTMFEERDDLDTIVISNVCLCFLLAMKEAVAQSIINLSVENASCFAQKDRSIITAKIEDQFYSIAAFERFVKTAACAMLARMSVFWGVELMPYHLTLWSQTARKCELHELADKIEAIDLAWLKQDAFAKIPDAPAVCKARERFMYLQATFTYDWFDKEILPLVQAELAATRAHPSSPCSRTCSNKETSRRRSSSTA